MLASKPQSHKEAEPFCGRQVRKAFFPEGCKKKPQYFTGIVTECPYFHGEYCYRIEYEDGDVEDVAWEELVTILLPEMQQGPLPSPSLGLTEATNRPGYANGRRNTHGKQKDGGPPSKRPRGTVEALAADRPAFEGSVKADKGTGLRTPMMEDAAEPTELGASAQQPRMQRQARVRGREAALVGERANDAADCNAAGGSSHQQQASGGKREQEEDLDAATDDTGDAGEAARPRKRRTQACVNKPSPAAAENQERMQETPEDEEEEADASGFVFRKVGAAGHLARIHLQNFMCHANFELDCGTHVSVVNGTNGSGKSAIMQALQMCLGASARETGRGTSVSSFVRTGAHEARVQVTIFNTGIDAFMPEVFGNRITVERVIKSSGASTFNLLDVRNHKANLGGEKPREVLDRMLDHFSVDASNPLTIITQDMARQFLAASRNDAMKKYDIFMQSTLMDKTQSDIKAANANVSAMMQRLQQTAAAYNEAKKEQAELRSRLEKLKSADKQLHHRDMLERAIAWRAVQHMEERLGAAIAASETKGPELVALYDQHLRSLAARRGELEERKKDLEEELQRHQEHISRHEHHIHDLVKAQKQAKANMERAKRSKDAAQSNLQRLASDKQDLDSKLENTNNGKAAEARRLFEEHQRQVTAKQAQIHYAQEAATTAVKALEDARIELAKLQGEERVARNNAAQTLDAVKATREKLQYLLSTQGSRLAIFNAVDLNRLIDQNQQRFRRRPIGPIGALLTVTEEKWVLAAETGVGSCFKDYLVGCAEDAALLRDLMRRVKYSGAVVSTSLDAALYDIPPSRRPANGFISLLDVLTVQDAEARVPVHNYLVDKFRIEGLVVVENELQGRTINYDCRAGPHITHAIDMLGNKYIRSGNLKYIERASKRWTESRLAPDTTRYIATLEGELEQLEAELRSHQEDVAAVAAKLQQAREEAARCDGEAKAAMQRKQRATTELGRILTAAPQMPSMEDDEEATIVMTQLADIQEELTSSQMALQNADEAYELAAQAYQQAASQAVNERSRFEKVAEQGQQLRNALLEAAEEFSTTENLRRAALGSKEQVISRLDKLRQGVADAEEKLRQAEAGASEVCSREEGNEALRDALAFSQELAAKQANRGARDQRYANPEDVIRAIMQYNGLEQQLTRVNDAIRKIEKDAGSSDVEELQIKLADKDKLVEVRLNVHRRMEKLLHSFQSAYEKQVTAFERRRNYVEQITMQHFVRYLRRRGHDGKLVWNHTERTLKMFVKPGGKTSKNVAAVEDLKQLSGGERSFTTVAFLLAIGASIDSPFRCMDEYDVFMDAITRRVATETLLEFAYENAAYQYIFLTPQDLQTVEDARQQFMQRKKVELPSAFMKTVQLRPARANAVAE